MRRTKPNPVEGEHTLFGFLTTEANDAVAAVRPEGDAVMLTTPDEMGTWMFAAAEEALRLQRPLPALCKS